MVDFSAFLPVWNNLTDEQQNRISRAAICRNAEKGTVLHGAGAHCTGLFLVESGQLRAYILSDQGREVTIYRLFERDLCLFSASCIMNSIQFDITIQAEKDTRLYIIPPEVYKQIMAESAPLANFTNEVMAARFSEVLWLVEQIMWKSMDKRVAHFLLNESVIERTATLKLTHEEIANHLGSHREVVTRMLHYLQHEGMVKLSRGIVQITNKDDLQQLCDL